LHLWLAGYDFPVDDLRWALRDEFGRWLARQRRTGPWRYDERTDTTPTQREQAKYEKQLGELDPDLKATGLQLPREVLLSLASALHWGTDEDDSRPSGSPSKPVPAGAIVTQLGLGGLFGSLDEIEGSGEEVLEGVTQDDLEKGREFFRLFALGLAAFPLAAGILIPKQRDKMLVAAEKAMQSMAGPDWLITTLIACILVAHSQTREP
jgi:hypothetical protein